MRPRLFALPLLLSLVAAAPHRPAAPAAAADGAGNRMAAFPPMSLPRPGDRPDPFVMHCSAEHWCARMAQDQTGRGWSIGVGHGAGMPMRADIEEGDEESEFAIWPHIVIEAGGAVLVGVEARRSTGYAGGGASGTRLILYRAEAGGGALHPVLDLPIGAAKDIRACFDSADRRHRLGACSDQYEFDGMLTLDPATRTGRPHFIYAARARTYPGRRSTDSDSTTAPPLRRSDLRWWTDPGCTYSRRFAFDPRENGYVPDRPLPACTDYLDF